MIAAILPDLLESFTNSPDDALGMHIERIGIGMLAFMLALAASFSNLYKHTETW